MRRCMTIAIGKFLQIRPEIRYDHASNPNFGPNFTQRSQLSLAFEALFKF